MCSLQRLQRFLDVVWNLRFGLSGLVHALLLPGLLALAQSHITQHLNLGLRLSLAKLLTDKMWLVGERLVEAQLGKITLLFDGLLAWPEPRTTERCHTLAAELLIVIPMRGLAVLTAGARDCQVLGLSLESACSQAVVVRLAY